MDSFQEINLNNSSFQLNESWIKISSLKNPKLNLKKVPGVVCYPSNESCFATLVFNGTNIQVLGLVVGAPLNSTEIDNKPYNECTDTSPAPLPSDSQFPHQPNRLVCVSNLAAGSHNLTITMNVQPSAHKPFLALFGIQNYDSTATPSSPATPSAVTTTVTGTTTRSSSQISGSSSNDFHRSGISQKSIFIPLMIVISVLVALLVAAVGYVLYLRHRRRKKASTRLLDNIPPRPATPLPVGFVPVTTQGLAGSRYFEPSRWLAAQGARSSSSSASISTATTDMSDEHRTTSKDNHDVEKWGQYSASLPVERKDRRLSDSNESIWVQSVHAI